MQTHDPVVRNVFICLVHDNFECLVDLMQNLRFFAPQSTILIYDGGHELKLASSTFPFNRYNAIIHPNPAPMRGGRQHRFALQCIEFALAELDCDTLTVVNSDQLLVRGEYERALASHLNQHPRTGLLGTGTRPFPPGMTVHPMSSALAEAHLWKHWLEQFSDGPHRFPRWTLWPGTVVTVEAGRAIVERLKQDEELVRLLEQTQICATEEILFPTLVDLLGYEVTETPLAPTYLRWRPVLRAEEVGSALAQLSAYWLHPVARNYSDPARTRLRERSNGYRPESRGRIDLSGTATWDGREISPEDTGDQAILAAARTIEGWLQDDEAGLLIAACRHLARSGKRGTVVEVGSYCGKSTVVLGLALRNAGNCGRVYAVDPFEGIVGALDQGVSHTHRTLDSFTESIRMAKLEDTVMTIEAHSYETPWNATIDLLFIDGLHDYPNVARDFFHFAPYLVGQSLVAFHDHSAYYPGVCNFVAELLATGAFRLLAQHGSLVLLERSPTSEIDNLASAETAVTGLSQGLSPIPKRRRPNP